MVMTKNGGGEERRAGSTGIPDADPVSVAKGGAGVGGSSNWVAPPRGPVRDTVIAPDNTGPHGDMHEDSTGDNNSAGAGSNTDLFGGGVNMARPTPGGPSNVNAAYPEGNHHPVTGTPLPAGEATGGTIHKGGRGSSYS